MNTATLKLPFKHHSFKWGPLYVGALLLITSPDSKAQSSSTNQGSLTPARAASIATSTAITNTVVNNPFGGFGVYRYRLGSNG